MAKKMKHDQEKSGKLQWFFFVIVVPALFALTLTVVVLTIMGTNVFEKAESYANQIPGLSAIVSTSDESQNGRQTHQLEAAIADQNEKIDQLQQQVEDKQLTIDELNQQIEQLETDLEAALATSAEQKTEEPPAASNPMKEMAVSFEEMDEEEAAPIIENMDQDLAVQILAEVASSQRGAILGAMTPEAAAEIAGLIAGPAAS
ncbi:magnesium transporter MgtE N-terminal domain-containing protein [Halobacillus naozhouensis]